MSERDTISALRGTLTIIIGCMFSGKTTELLGLLSAYPSSSVLAFKHVSDRRYRSDAIVSHAGLARKAVPIASARELLELATGENRIVGIDEVHFFDKQIVDAVRTLMERGCDVLATALDRDSWGRSFPVVDRLVALANTPVTKVAVCAQCGATADHTQRTTPIVGGDMVGGAESFEPRCAACWHPPPEQPPP
jgi:thymidine kinase